MERGEKLMNRIYKITYQIRGLDDIWRNGEDTYTKFGDKLKERLKWVREHSFSFKDVHVYESELNWKEINV